MDIPAVRASLRRFAAELLEFADRTAIELDAGPGGKTHVLIDWENVQPGDADVRALVPDATDLWLFHGPNQKNVAAQHASFGERATAVRIARTGKNALDFHLSFYIGYIASRQPQARFVVLSNDKGYGPMLEHAKALGFAADQLGFVRPGRGAAAKKAAAGKTRRASGTAGATGTTRAAGTTARATKTSAKTAAKTRPATAAKSPARRAAKASTSAAPAAKAAKPPSAPAAAKRTSPRAAAKKTAATPASRKPAAAAPPAAPPIAAPRTAAKTGTSRHKAKSFDDVLALLGKRPVTRLARKEARLLTDIAQMIGVAADSGEAQAMLVRLVAAGKVSVDERRTVHYTL